MRRWFVNYIERQRKDIYARKAKLEGFRSRAAYKLADLNLKFKFLKPGMKVLDLGAAPGGWSQYAANAVLSKAEAPSVVALDLLPMQPLAGVSILKGDIGDKLVIEKVMRALEGQADVLLCDMSGNHTGDGNVDSGVTVDLGIQALQLAHKALKPGGCAVMKVFSGISEPDHFVLSNQTFVKSLFGALQRVKPEASRPESRELYYLCRNWQSISQRVPTPVEAPQLLSEPEPESDATPVTDETLFVCDGALSRLHESRKSKSEDPVRD